MADEDQYDQDTDDAGVSEDDARQLLGVGPDGKAGTAQGGGQNASQSSDQDDDDDDPEGADQLGDAGKRALDAMKARARARREERDRLKAELDRVSAELRKHSDKDKSELQREREEKEALKAELNKVASAQKRRDAAEDYAPDDAPPALIRAASGYISGDTEEELKDSAEKFYALFTSVNPPKAPVPGRPKERLRGGGNPPDEDDEEDPIKLAARLPRRH